MKKLKRKLWKRLVIDEELLLRLWRELSPPQSEDSLIQNWYGAIYEHKKLTFMFAKTFVDSFLALMDQSQQLNWIVLNQNLELEQC